MQMDGKVLIGEYVYLRRLMKSGENLRYNSNWRMTFTSHNIYCCVTVIPVAGVINPMNFYKNDNER